jgi:AMP nucleosidase
MIVSHYAGLRHTQRLGDYVLAHAYARLDHVLDNDLPLEVPIPAIAEVQVALTNAIGNCTMMSFQPPLTNPAPLLLIYNPQQ